LPIASGVETIVYGKYSGRKNGLANYLRQIPLKEKPGPTIGENKRNPADFILICCVKCLGYAVEK